MYNRIPDRESREIKVDSESMKNVENFPSVYSEVGESIIRLGPKDPFRTYRWKSINNISEIHRTEAFYVLHTNVRISRFLESKKLEELLLGLSVSEFEAVVSIPGALSDRLWTDLLRARNSLVSLGLDRERAVQILLERVQPLRKSLGWTEWNFHLLNTYRGNLKYELVQVQERIRKVNKYSGYIKTPSAAGSKRFQRIQDSDLETTDRGFYRERNFYDFFISPTEDFSLLEFNAGSLYTNTLLKNLKERKELPEELKPFIFRDWIRLDLDPSDL